MNLRRIFTVARKELKDAFRDRRQLISILVASLASPLLIAFLFNRIAEDRRGAEEIKVPVVGQQYAPVLLDWLEQQAGVQVVAGPADPEGAVRERKEDLVVVIPKDFAERFRDSKPAKVKLVSDSTSSRGRFKVERVRTLLQRYGAEIGGLRLIARGLSNQEIAMTLVVHERTVAKYVSSVLNKLHLTNRTQAALYAIREGMTASAN